MKKLKQKLEKNCSALSFKVSAENQQKLLVYLEQLKKWNKTYNLTAITDPEKMLSHHIMDSLVVSPFVLAERIADVGTGAGLPGIPLAILHPDKQFLLVDSNGKKVRFMRQVAHLLGLKNVVAKHSRVELVEEKVDMVLSRAFASLQDMISSTVHLLEKGGEFLAMKGKVPQQEMVELGDNVEVISINKIEVPGLIAERCLIKIKLK